MECKRCNKPISRTKKGVNCSQCKSAYHVGCGQISDVLFKEIEAGADWRCVSCKASSKRQSLVNLGVSHSAFSSVNDLTSFVSPLLTSSGNQISSKWDATMKKFSENIKSLNDNQQSFIASINDMNDQLLALQTIGTTVEQHSNEIKGLKSENEMLKTSIKLITTRLDNFEQKEYQCKIQIADNENLQETVINIIKKLEITLLAGDIADIYRVRNRKKNANEQQSSQQQAEGHIVVTFRSREKRDVILNKSRKNRELFIDDNKKIKIYINELLTSNRRRLLHKAKLFGRENNYKFVWTKNGKILMKMTEDSRVVHVNMHTNFASIREDVDEEAGAK